MARVSPNHPACIIDYLALCKCSIRNIGGAYTLIRAVQGPMNALVNGYPVADFFEAAIRLAAALALMPAYVNCSRSLLS